MKKQRGGRFLETCPLSPASKWQDCCWSLGRTPKPLSLPSPTGMPVSQEKRRKQTSLRCPFSPGQRQGQLSQSGQRAIPRPPPPQSRRECRRGSQAPGGSSKHSEGAGLALVPGIRTSPPLPDVLFLHLILILRLFHLTFKKEDQPLQLSLPQDLRVLQGQSPQVCMSCSAQLQGAPLTFEVTVDT